MKGVFPDELKSFEVVMPPPTIPRTLTPPAVLVRLVKSSFCFDTVRAIRNHKRLIASRLMLFVE